MTDRVLKIWFYERDKALTISVVKDDYERLLQNLKYLAAGSQEIASYFTLKVSDQTAVLISIKDIVALYAVKQGSVDTPNVDGARLVLRHSPKPIDIAFDENGPFGDLIDEMIETGYTETPEGCVMMPDTEGGSIFFRPDDIQYVILDSRYLLA